MKKTFWITLVVFILTVVAYNVKPYRANHKPLLGENFAEIGIFVIIAATPFFLIGAIILGFVIWYFRKRINKEIVQMISLSLLGFVTIMLLIITIIAYAEKPLKETVLNGYGGETKMLDAIEKLILEANTELELTLVSKRSGEEEYQKEKAPTAEYEYEVIFTNKQGVVYKGDLEVSVMCFEGSGDGNGCWVTEEFKSLKTDAGYVFDKEKDIEDMTREEVIYFSQTNNYRFHPYF